MIEGSIVIICKRRELLLFIICSVKLTAQNNINDILNLIKSDKSDTTKLIHLNKVCKEYILINDYSNALSYGKQALSLATHLMAENKNTLVLLVIKKNMFEKC